ncbi:MAG: peroxiredoxin [Bermanella sp.]|jgi:peroxiredoxin
MNKIKSIFITLYSVGAMVATVHIVINMFNNGLNSAWTGALLGTLPASIFFSNLLLRKNIARTSSNLPLIIILGFAGMIISAILPQAGVFPFYYAVGFGAVGSLLYVFWYSRIDRSEAKITEGDTLPDFTLFTYKGEAVESSILRKQPSLILFFRGNWCPLCMAQIKEIAASYKELDQRGVKIFLVSPQSDGQSRHLAKQFSVPMQFLVDKNLQAATKLGLTHKDGTPMGMIGYESDTVMPTAILTDKNGDVIFADLTDNYRVRPEPQTFLDILDRHTTTEIIRQSKMF